MEKNHHRIAGLFGDGLSLDLSQLFVPPRNGRAGISRGMGVLHIGCLLFDRILFCPAEVSVKNKLRELRAAKEWSQADLADKLGVSRQTVNAIETEKYDPSLPLAFKVARLFKKSIEEIFELDKD